MAGATVVTARAASCVSERSRCHRDGDGKCAKQQRSKAPQLHHFCLPLPPDRNSRGSALDAGPRLVAGMISSAEAAHKTSDRWDCSALANQYRILEIRTEIADELIDEGLQTASGS